MAELEITFENGKIVELDSSIPDDFTERDDVSVPDIDYVPAEEDPNDRSGTASGYESPGLLGEGLHIVFDIGVDVTSAVLAAWIYNKASDYDVDVVRIAGEMVPIDKDKLASKIDDLWNDGDS